jgi:hypothetical protein
MQELELTPAWIESVWWLIAWRAMVGGWIIALVLAFLIGEVGARAGIAFEPVAAFATIVAWLAALAWGFVVVRMALRKRYGEFRLALIKKT